MHIYNIFQFFFPRSIDINLLSNVLVFFNDLYFKRNDCTIFRTLLLKDRGLKKVNKIWGFHVAWINKIKFLHSKSDYRVSNETINNMYVWKIVQLI